MILADMGADVIHVEHPEKGNSMRAMGPHKGEWGAYFVAVNRGKRSLALDVSQPEGRDLILRLVKGCARTAEAMRSAGRYPTIVVSEPSATAVR